MVFETPARAPCAKSLPSPQRTALKLNGCHTHVLRQMHFHELLGDRLMSGNIDPCNPGLTRSIVAPAVGGEEGGKNVIHARPATKTDRFFPPLSRPTT